jgi:hypothetical protein
MGAPEYAGIVGFGMIFGLPVVLEVVFALGFDGVFHQNLYVTPRGSGGSLV